MLQNLVEEIIIILLRQVLYMIEHNNVLVIGAA